MKEKLFKTVPQKGIPFALILLIAVTILVLTIYMGRISRTAMNFTQGYMKELAEHDSQNITDKLDGYRATILECTDMIRLQQIDDVESAMNLLKLKRLANRLNDLFLIGSDGMTYSYNNTITDRSNEAYIRSVTEQGREYLAKPDAASTWYEWNNSLRYAIPIDALRLDGKEIVGICGEYPFEEIGASLQQESFGGEGVSTLIDRNGNVLSQTGIVSQKPVDNNFFKHISDQFQVKGEDSAQSLLADFQAMRQVEFQYRLDGRDYLCVSVPMPQLELTLISSVPLEIARQQYTRMLQMTLQTVLIIAVLVLALGLGFYRVYSISVRLESQKDAAEQVAAEKSKFLSNMSHEIRTPLNAIIGFSELLSRSRTLSRQDREQVEKIGTSSHYLLSLINDILDMSRIDGGKMELAPEPMEIDTLIRGIDSIIGSQAGQKGIQYAVVNNCKGLCILADYTRLEQILINLLGNSLKFTPAGGRICLDVDCPKESAERVLVRFTVSDTGCGMSPEFLKLIFTPFMQEYNKNMKKQTGTGLGLPICKELCRLMGGSIRVESTLGEGSCFTVEIPFAKEAHLQDAGAHKSRQGSIDWSEITVLVAEDNELNAEILLSFLRMRQIKTLWAQNGREALEMFCASAPDAISLILMDVQMPEMNGLEAAERIRASGHPRAGTVPILAATADAFTSDVELVRAHGMDGHISKPIDIDQLFEKLGQCLQKEEEKHE